MNGLGVYMYDWTWNLGLIWGLVSFDPFDTWSWKVTDVYFNVPNS